MATKRPHGLAGFLILALVIAPDADGQDVNAGRELIEREWEYLEPAPTFTEFDTASPVPQRYDGGRSQEMRRGSHPRHHGNRRELTSVRAAKRAGISADGLSIPGDGLGPAMDWGHCTMRSLVQPVTLAVDHRESITM